MRARPGVNSALAGSKVKPARRFLKAKLVALGALVLVVLVAWGSGYLGYGWAKASKTTVKKFQDLGRDYLRGRVTLKRVYLLIDSRHGLKSVDTEALDALDLAAVSYQIVLTKADKLKKGEGERMAEATLKAVSKRPAAYPAVALTSAEKGLGMPELRLAIMQATGTAP